MNYDNISPLQIHRIDALGSFVEVMASSLSIGKIQINFLSYDKTKPANQRATATISFYMDVLRAKALADKIMNGKMARLWKKSKDAAAAANNKYPAAIFTEQGGTPAQRANRPDGKALSRTMTLAPGSKKPWVLTAECGPGVPGPNGLLIVPDYGYNKAIKKPEHIVRIAMDNDKLEEFAEALNAAYMTWVMAKFVPQVQPEMKQRCDTWKKTHDFGKNKKATSSATVVYEDDKDVPHASEKAEGNQVTNATKRITVMD